jgi:predicted choloylglycine hydrolase
MPSALRVSFVQCRGTPDEVGRAQADVLVTRKAQLPPWFDIRSEECAFRACASDLWEEISGIAERLTILKEQAVLCFGHDGLLMPTGRCSARAYGRSDDFRQRVSGGALVQARGSYASIGGSHQLIVRLDGMNEHWLTIGWHLVKVRPICRSHQHFAGQAGA